MGTPFSAINKYVHHNMTYVLQKVVCAKHTKPNIACLIPIITMNLMMKVVFPMGGGGGAGITRTFVILFRFTFSLVPICYCIWVVMWYKMIMTNELFSLYFSLTRAGHMTYIWEANIIPTSTPCSGDRDRVHVTIRTPVTASSLLSPFAISYFAMTFGSPLLPLFW